MMQVKNEEKTDLEACFDQDFIFQISESAHDCV